MAVIAYFDTMEGTGATAAKGTHGAGIPNISADITDVVTFGYRKKNDGGGGHYKRYVDLPPYSPYLAFNDANSGTSTGHWGFVPDSGTVSPLQAGAYGDNSTNDTAALQACIDYIDRWNTRTNYDSDNTDPDNGYDSSQTSVKLILPANRTFVVDATVATPTVPVRLQLRGPITIEGEDRFTSRIRLKESTTDSANPVNVFGQINQDDSVSCLFLAKNLRPTDLNLNIPPRGVRLAFRNFTMTGSYGTGTGELTTHGVAQLLKFTSVDELVFEDMVFRRSRAVVIGGDGVRKLAMRGCLMEESRRGGLVVTRAETSVVEDNDLRWVGDDPVAITGTVSVVASDIVNGGSVSVVNNRVFGSRGLNVVGAKNVLIADNSSVLGRGRAIHIGAVTEQTKGDTTTLDVIVRNNVITDLLDSKVDPEQSQATGSHRAIDIEILQAGVDANGAIPGLPPRFPAGRSSIRRPITTGRGRACRGETSGSPASIMTPTS